jgi:hypothetical protein
LKFELIMWVRILDSKRPAGCIGYEK